MKYVTLLILFYALAFSACVDCEQIEKDARSLKAGYQNCSGEDTCQIVSMYELAGPNNCLGPFQCPAAFNVNADLDQFESKAKKLVDDYKDCQQCATASCLGEDELIAECDTDAGVCVTIENWNND
jgi:hypothetical protein